MRLLSLSMAVLLAATMTSASLYHMSYGSMSSSGMQPPPPTPPGGGTSGPVDWKFSSPANGSECFGSVVFMGTGPQSSTGGLAVYSYDNQIPGTVQPSELTLQIAMLVDTDPGIDWIGSTWNLTGSYCATILPATGTINMALLGLLGPTDPGNDVYTLTMVNSGDTVEFTVVNP